MNLWWVQHFPYLVSGGLNLFLRLRLLFRFDLGVCFSLHELLLSLSLFPLLVRDLRFHMLVIEVHRLGGVFVQIESRRIMRRRKCASLLLRMEGERLPVLDYEGDDY